MHRIRTAALLAVLPLVLVAGCGSDDGSSPTSGKPGSVECSYPDADAAAKKVAKPPRFTDPDVSPEVVISTSAGDVPVTLDPAKAPCTVNSFLSLAKQGYFNGTTCHRLITQGAFILQCGDPTALGTGGPGYSFDDELVDNDPRLQPCQNMGNQVACTYNTGTLAMANSGPDTNGSQFFLVYGNSQFAPDYTVFGQMDAGGVKVLKDVAAKGTDTGAVEGAPKVPVTIDGVK